MDGKVKELVKGKQLTGAEKVAFYRFSINYLLVKIL